MADDHQYDAALDRADVHGLPAALRDYLTNTKRQKHRDEARAQIAMYYDRAIDGLKRRTAGQEEINKEFLAGVLALLEAMKQ